MDDLKILYRDKKSRKRQVRRRRTGNKSCCLLNSISESRQQQHPKQRRVAMQKTFYSFTCAPLPDVVVVVDVAIESAESERGKLPSCLKWTCVPSCCSSSSFSSLGCRCPLLFTFYLSLSLRSLRSVSVSIIRSVKTGNRVKRVEQGRENVTKRSRETSVYCCWKWPNRIYRSTRFYFLQRRRSRRRRRPCRVFFCFLIFYFLFI